MHRLLKYYSVKPRLNLVKCYPLKLYLPLVLYIPRETEKSRIFKENCIRESGDKWNISCYSMVFQI